MFAAIVLIGTVANASAQTSDQKLDAVESGLRTLGITVSRQEDSDLTRLVIDCDEATALGAIPTLQAKGLMNPAVTRAQVNSAPVSFAMMVALMGVVGYVQPLYQNSKSTDQLIAKVNLLAPDDEGRVQTHPLFSFSFNREIFDGIDWTHFADARFPRVAAHFNYSQWFKERSQAELR